MAKKIKLILEYTAAIIVGVVGLLWVFIKIGVAIIFPSKGYTRRRVIKEMKEGFRAAAYKTD